MMVAIKKYITVGKDGKVTYETDYIANGKRITFKSDKATTLEEDKKCNPFGKLDYKSKATQDKIDKIKLKALDMVGEADEDEEDTCDRVLEESLEKLKNALEDLFKDDDEESEEEAEDKFDNQPGEITTVAASDHKEILNLKERIAKLEEKVFADSEE